MRIEFDLTLAELPFRMRPFRPLTDKQLLSLSSRNRVCLVEREPDGDLTVRPIGGTFAGFVSGDILVNLANWSEQTGLGKTLPNVGYFLPDGSMRGPRISWLRQEKWDRFAGGPDGFIRDVPDFVVEIVCGTYTRQELQERMCMWLANGVPLGWLVDSERRTIQIFRQRSKPEVVNAKVVVHGEGPVAGFVLELGISGVSAITGVDSRHGARDFRHQSAVPYLATRANVSG